MKKFCIVLSSVLLVLMLSMILLPSEASAATSGYYTYTVSNGEVTITDVNTSISGKLIIPVTLDGYPVTKIGDEAFVGCTRLTSVTIPEGVISIGMWAFCDCISLKSITIPKSMQAIEPEAFDRCDSLSEVHISDISAWCSIVFDEIDMGCMLYFENGNPLSYGGKLYLNGELVTRLEIPNTVSEIKEYAFENCQSITTVVIPSSVSTIGIMAFASCYQLTSVQYCGSIEDFNNIEIGYGNGMLTSAAFTQHQWTGGDCSTPATCELCGEVANEAFHTWIAATCTTPKYCFVCEIVEGDALGHSWKNATCTAPKTCSACGATEGSANGHKWNPATCTSPKTCSVCKTTTGGLLAHNWIAANCTTPKTCSACGKTEGNPQHAWIPANCTSPEHCSACGLTEGEPEHSYSNHDDYTCNICGYSRMPKDPYLKFYGNAGMSLKDYIGMQILFKNSTASTYDKVYAVAVQHTPTGDITTILSGSPYSTQYTLFEAKILARSMNDEVTLTLYGEKNGITFQGVSINTSIKKLSMEKLATYEAQGAYDKCKILVDMLNFGATVQLTFNVNIHDLPNTELGKYEIYASTYEPDLQAVNSITGTAQVKVRQHNISMQDRVEIQQLFTADISAYRAVATVDGVEVEVNVDTESYAQQGYTIVRVPVAPANFRKTYTIALYDANGNSVTQIYQVSVEGYANARKTTEKHALDVALMRYSDSVAAVFHSN